MEGWNLCFSCLIDGTGEHAPITLEEAAYTLQCWQEEGNELAEENARAKGKQIGRKPVTKEDLPAVFFKYYPSYVSGSMTVTELARVCGLSRPTAYKYIHMME